MTPFKTIYLFGKISFFQDHFRNMLTFTSKIDSFQDHCSYTFKIHFFQDHLNIRLKPPDCLLSRPLSTWCKLISFKTITKCDILASFKTIGKRKYSYNRIYNGIDSFQDHLDIRLILHGRNPKFTSFKTITVLACSYRPMYT